jgi:hypothetical protein
MRAWFLFEIIAFLVFCMPLIDDLYKMNMRRKVRAACQISGESPSLVPNVNPEDPPASRAEVIEALEEA